MIDQLLAASTPVNGVDKDGSTILHEAAFTGRADSVRHLLARGAGPDHGHDEAEQILAPITPEPRPRTTRVGRRASS